MFNACVQDPEACTIHVGAGLPRETGNAEDGTGFAGVRGASPLPQESRQLLDVGEQAQQHVANGLCLAEDLLRDRGFQGLDVFMGVHGGGVPGWRWRSGKSGWDGVGCNGVS